MSETVDKVTDKLMASIQKSQNSANTTKQSSTSPSKADETKVAPKTAAKPKSAAKPKAAPKASTASEPGVKKIIDQIVNSIETPRKFNHNLRWPD